LKERLLGPKEKETEETGAEIEAGTKAEAGPK